MRRALERERYLRRPVVQAKLWLQRIIAGKPRLPDEPQVDAELDREVHAAPAPKPSVDAQPRSPRIAADRVRPVRYFYDTEFIDNGRIIELISIGVVAEDGREYYAISTEFDPERAGRWVRANVLPKLPPPVVAAVAVAGARSGTDLESSSTSTATSRSSCGPGWPPTTTWRCASCGGR